MFQDFVPVNKTKEQKMHICLAIFSTFFLIITIVFTFDFNFVVLKNITVNAIPWRFTWANVNVYDFSICFVFADKTVG